MEFDASTHSAQSWKGGRESIELWDISGDKKFEKCFPAIMKGAVGVILVYNPDDAEHVNQLQYWCAKRLCLSQIPQTTWLGGSPRQRPLEASLASWLILLAVVRMIRAGTISLSGR